MNPILSAGLLIGVLCGAWTFVMGLTGWFKDPVLLRLFFVVILIEIAGLVWGLRQTAAEGRTYGGQIVAGTMMAIIAGVIVIASSLLFTTVVFPDYFNEMQSAYRTILQQQGKSEAEIAQLLRNEMSGQTPMSQAMAGFLGTLVTGIVASAIIAIWVRSKSFVRRTAA
jgi:TM2 domain-containing membrane protein YozV